MRVLGVDFGDKRTGLAVSDPAGFLANGLCTVTADGKRALAAKIAGIAKERGCGRIVLGCPLNLDGTVGPRAQRAKEFGRLLSEASGLAVVLFDERCTTTEAHEFLDHTGTRGKRRKGVVDTLAAQIILQDYLDSGAAKQ